MKYLVLLFALLVSATAQAENAVSLPDPPTLRLELQELHLPRYTACNVDDVRYACYTLEQQKELLSIEAKAEGWRLQIVSLISLYGAQSRVITALEQQLVLSMQNDKWGREHAEDLVEQLNQAIAEKNDWRAKAETPVIWPYVVGGSGLVLGLGIALGAYLAR